MRLEDLTKGATVKGILTNQVVTVIDVKWFGADALELTYKDALGGKVFDLLGKAIASAELRELLIDAIRYGDRPIVESHSEHLLRRLQRRIAAEELANTDAALYFCQTDNQGDSQLIPLQLDMLCYLFRCAR
jgi:hypothetical protein